MNNLKNKVAFVTGSSGGLGKAIAERYGQLGANVIVHYNKNKDKADEVVKNIMANGVKSIAVKGDTTNVKEIEQMFSEAKAAFGKLDIIVANAGMEHVELPVTEFTEVQYDQLFTLNTKGSYFSIQQAARLVEDNGRIIYIASSTTSFPVPGRLFMAAVKIHLSTW